MFASPNATPSTISVHFEKKGLSLELEEPSHLVGYELLQLRLCQW